MLIRSLAIVAAFLAAAPAAAQVSSRSSPRIAPRADAMDDFIAVMRRHLPHDLGDGVRLVEARREGNTAILVVDGPAEYFGVLTPSQAAGYFAGGFCRGERADQFFQRGYRLRVDLRTGERLARGEEIARCPR